MRSTRSTSFKSRFNNTQQTVVNVDEDDDDFVSPPIEGEGSEPIHINIVGSNKTIEQRKKTSRSEHGKKNVESGKSANNKDKQETITIDSTSVGRMKRKCSARTTPAKDTKKSAEENVKGKKPRSLNELLMESMSGSKRDNEKVEIGVDMEDKENVVKRKKAVNDAHSKKSPKRKKGKIEHENVKIKTVEGNIRNVRKDHQEGYRRLATRMTPRKVSVTT
ncbi:unnamed protein product [Lactuca saligna]|uniref:Uncharacterized protein n=1 Tax=Lactuca saligna TaxID=75948 RepID=A0AA35YIW3_LACSI|nr:unnamed protein product [Lactuca saligna]